ncbi:hypothetical protein Syun_012170 [Stephania yunnanensis]|uniref:RING-type E3 ubiquitin transferase n=1 Tax=Stephania yunnanensis TaxID=152371 RepID=A0AAP0K180_9MAGN
MAATRDDVHRTLTSHVHKDSRPKHSPILPNKTLSRPQGHSRPKHSLILPNENPTLINLLIDLQHQYKIELETMNNTTETPISFNSGSTQNSPFMKMGLKIMLSAVLSGFLVLAFIFVVHLYANWSLTRRANNNSFGGSRRRRRFDFAPDLASLTNQGLNHATLLTLPVLTFRSREFKDGLQCAVCLSDIVDGEKARLLPNCKHGFHVDCIDMWFKSHKTCPLCRTPVDDRECLQTQQVSNTNNINNSVVGSAFGNESRNPEINGVANSTSSSRTALVIEIPAVVLLGSTSGPARGDEEGLKSPRTPRLIRSLSRLLSLGRTVRSPRSPNVVDIERGHGERDQ